MNALLKLAVNFMLNTRGGSLFVTKSVREWIFDGYNDTLLTFLKGLDSPAFNLPFDRFGWFVGRNLSSEYDGRINMYAGQEDISKMGKVYSWNGETRTRFYRDGCGAINGTTGELWYPNIAATKPVTIFATDICRSVTLNYNSTTERYGIQGSKWIADQSVLDNGSKYPEMSCFCTGAPNTCPDLPSGVLNVSDCRYGAPAFISFPHFYLADSSYTKDISGMNPDPEKHEFTMALEPNTGIPLEVNARLQINILLQPIEHVK